MGLVELIQQKAFIGREFLTWLWFRSERDGQVEMRDDKPITVEILGPILLEAQYGDARASALKGDSPATSPEAQTALIEGKKLRRTRLTFKRESTEWSVTIDGETFSISGLSIPNPGRMPFEDYLSLRTEMLLDFDQVLDSLFEEFLVLRLDNDAWTGELMEIHSWVREK